MDPAEKLSDHIPFYLHPQYVHRLRLAAETEQEVPTCSVLERRNLQVAGRVAVIAVDDVLINRGSWFWGIPMSELGLLVDKMAADPGISAIVLDIDCPGGVVFGMQELNDKIVAARSQKPVWGVANSWAASGGFWLLSACAKRVVAPGGQVGSHGVIVRHFDYSKMMEEAGIAETVITSSPHKAEFDDTAPLSETARDRLQEIVDSYHARFTDALAMNYGVNRAKVEKDFGQGRMFLDQEAKAVGIVEQISTLEKIVENLASRGGGKRTGIRANSGSLKMKQRRLDMLKRRG